MPSPASASTRCAVLLVLGAMLLSSAAAQTRVNGVVPACAAIAPADVVAEVRAGLAWFPFEVGRGTVGADGSFALRVHEQPNLPVELTATVMHLFDGLRCEQVTISDHAARIVVVRDLRVIPRGAPCEYCETLGRLYAATRTQGRHATSSAREIIAPPPCGWSTGTRRYRFTPRDRSTRFLGHATSSLGAVTLVMCPRLGPTCTATFPAR